VNTAALLALLVHTRVLFPQVPLSPAAAKEGADAFAKELYQRLFLFLVSCINTATAAPPLPSSHPSQTYSVIGLLDIFGFESFETNRFEQLCINWCNEKLQQKFTVDVFQAVVREYEQEGIELQVRRASIGPVQAANVLQTNRRAIAGPTRANSPLSPL